MDTQGKTIDDLRNLSMNQLKSIFNIDVDKEEETYVLSCKEEFIKIVKDSEYEQFAYNLFVQILRTIYLYPKWIREDKEIAENLTEDLQIAENLLLIYSEETIKISNSKSKRKTLFAGVVPVLKNILEDEYKRRFLADEELCSTYQELNELLRSAEYEDLIVRYIAINDKITKTAARRKYNIMAKRKFRQDILEYYQRIPKKIINREQIKRTIKDLTTKIKRGAYSKIPAISYLIILRFEEVSMIETRTDSQYGIIYNTLKCFDLVDNDLEDNWNKIDKPFHDRIQWLRSKNKYVKAQKIESNSF